MRLTGGAGAGLLLSALALVRPSPAGAEQGGSDANRPMTDPPRPESAAVERGETAAAAEPEAAAEEEGWSFRGGGGLVLIPSWVQLEGDTGRFGLVIGGGGYANLWRDSLRLGGWGAEVLAGDEASEEFRASFGGLWLEYGVRIEPWFEIPFGVAIAFGTGRLNKVLDVPAPGRAPEDAEVLLRESGFLVLLAPTVSFAFIPLRFLKISLVGQATYLHWLPREGWSVGGGISLFFGSFREE